MLCMICKKNHASWEQAVFRGTKPTRIRLCNACAQEKDAEGHMARIKGAADHEAKNAAVDGFLRALEA